MPRDTRIMPPRSFPSQPKEGHAPTVCVGESFRSGVPSSGPALRCTLDREEAETAVGDDLRKADEASVTHEGFSVTQVTNRSHGRERR